MVRSRVELFEQIRRDRRLEELSIRELAERHRVHRRTVRQALASRGAAAAQGVPARGRGRRWTPWVGGDRRLAGGGPGGAAQAAAHRPAGVAAAGRRARREAGRVDGVALRRAAPASSSGWTGVEVTVPQTHLPGRRGRGRLRRVLRD